MHKFLAHVVLGNVTFGRYLKNLVGDPYKVLLLEELLSKLPDVLVAL